MSYSKLIHEYLDGQTDMVHEDMLFAELAKNPELRVEFNQQVQLQNVALSDMRTITPPADTTNLIFSSLGFSIPSKEFLNRISATTVSEVAKKATVGSRFIGFMKKHTVTFASVIITALLTTGIFIITDDRFQTIEMPGFDLNQQAAEIPMITAKELAVDDGNTYVNQRKISNAANLGDAVQTLTANELNNDNDNLKKRISKSASVDIALNNAPLNTLNSPTNSMTSANRSMVDPLTDMLNLKPARNFNDGNLAFIISYQHSNPTNVDIDNSLLAKGFKSNISVTALYKVGDSWYVGGQFGKENFAMNFDRNLYGEQLNYQQNPSLWFLGATTRWSPSLDNMMGLNISALTKPYAQLTLGTTSSTGFFGSGQIGLTLTPYNNFAMNLGYEYKALFYQVDGNTENTLKDGLTLGFGLSF